MDNGLEKEYENAEEYYQTIREIFVELIDKDTTEFYLTACFYRFMDARRRVLDLRNALLTSRVNNNG
jgi:hypothetical protein